MVELDRAAISRRIATARVQAGLTQPELADALDPPVHWRTVQTWESGERNKKTKEKTWSPPFRRLGQIAEVTGKSKEWLLHGDRPNEDDIAARLARIEQALEELVARSGQAEPSEQAKRPLGQ